MLVMSPPAQSNILLGSQARDKHEVSKKMNIEMEELFAPWVIEKTKHLKAPSKFLTLHMHNSQAPDAPDGQ